MGIPSLDLENRHDVLIWDEESGMRVNFQRKKR